MSTEADKGPSGFDQLDDDTKLLHSMGYAQELRRSLGAFSNFAVSFTIISVLSGCLTLYYYGMSTGGPATMVWGWLLVGVMTTIVGLGMAEICSAYPTAGGLYYWSARLAKKNTAQWSWYTGWFNLLGQIAVTAGIDFGFASFFAAFLALTTSIVPDRHTVLLCYAGILIVHALLNIFGVKIVAFLSDVSVWWHVLGVAIIVVALILVPAHHASTSFVFTKFVNLTGFGNKVYVFFIGLLMAQYTFTGYDASAHMSEETHNAAVAGPKGIVNSIVVSLVAGFALILGITYAITSMAAYNAERTSAIGFPPAQIWIDAIGRTGGELLMVIALVAQAFCGMASVAANSRMIYAFSRDGAIPGSSFWHQINPKTRTPTRAVWFAVVFAFVLGLPYEWSPTAYGAVTSIATIGLYIAYIIPTFLRLRLGAQFKVGPWNLGKWSSVIGIIGVIWVILITVIFMLPESSPITRDTFNYAPVAVLVVIGFAFLYWHMSAKNWFKGPKIQGSEADLEALESELATEEAG